jgi:D-alanyl-D-alanine carboxypeptidase
MGKGFSLLLTQFFLLYITGFFGYACVTASSDISQPVLTEEGQTRFGDYLDLREGFLSEKKDFLEIDSTEMKVRLYSKGKTENTFPILYKKERLPSGLFSVQSKKKAAFSMNSGVYLPYALNYYGSCQIHGEPYSGLGQKTDSDKDMECLTLSDRDAKILFNSAKIGLPVLVIDKEIRRIKAAKLTVGDFPDISAKSFLVADIDSGQILAEKNSEVPLPIASLTKLMTAVVVEEQVDLKSAVLVKNWMLRPYGKTKSLAAGFSYPLEQLFYPLLQESSNDAAEVLNSAVPGGNAIYFMNQRARSILMEKTGFVDAHGIDVGNQATARDLFYLARYVEEFHPEIFEITKGLKPAGFSASIFPYSKNKNLFCSDQNFIGGKTGYIIESKYNGLFLFNLPMAEGKDKRVVIIVLGAPHWQTMQGNLKGETAKILAWVRDNYSSQSQ